MNSLWWTALPVLLLPVWWHRQKRQRVKFEPLATARFLPPADPQQLRVWRWTDRLLLLVRCLLLFGVIALLADLALPWRGDTVLVAAGTDPAWLERQIGDAGFKGASRIELPAADPLEWLAAHEREWKPGARLLVAGEISMPAALPQLRNRVELRSAPQQFSKADHHVAVVSKRAAHWRALFAALDGPQRYLVTDTPDARSELIVWDRPTAPPANLRAPLWWIVDTSAFPELRNAASIGGMRYADSTRGRLWSASAWPPADADAARALFETWQRRHYAPVAFPAPSMVIAASPAARSAASSGALRELLLIALTVLFALERILAHASRR
jgi:hypothetical protein